MRVERSLQGKRCVDGSLMKEFVISGPLSGELAGCFRNFGEVQILALHGKEFLSFEKPRFISVKGVLGENTVEVRYAPGVYDLAPDLFHLFLYYCSQEKGIEKMKEILAAMEGRIREPTGC